MSLVDYLLNPDYPNSTSTTQAYLLGWKPKPEEDKNDFWGEDFRWSLPKIETGMPRVDTGEPGGGTTPIPAWRRLT